MAPLADRARPPAAAPADAAADRRRPGPVGLGQVLVRGVRAGGADPPRAEQPGEPTRWRSSRRSRPSSPGCERSTLPDGEIAVLRRDQGLRRQALLAGLERTAHRDVICVSLQRLALRRLRAGLGRPGALDHRAARGRADGRRAAPLAPGVCGGAAQGPVLGRLRRARGRLHPRGGDRRRCSAPPTPATSSRTGPAGSSALVPIVAVLVIAWRFIRVVQPVSAQVAGYVQGPDYAAHMGYQNEVIDDLKFLHSRLPGHPRVVVFVDDLDRCSDESIMETLQAINLVARRERLLRRPRHRPGHDPPRDRPPARGERQRRAGRAVRGELPPQDHPAAAAPAREDRRPALRLRDASCSARPPSASSRRRGRTTTARRRHRRRPPPAATGGRPSPGTPKPWSGHASRCCARSRTPRTSSTR